MYKLLHFKKKKERFHNHTKTLIALFGVWTFSPIVQQQGGTHLLASCHRSRRWHQIAPEVTGLVATTHSQ